MLSNTSIRSNLNRRWPLRDGYRAGRALLPCIFLFALGFASLPAQADNTTSGAGASAGLGSQFAIADFDGDLHPDVASIDSSITVAGSAHYRIQLRLSSVGPQSIQLIAPGGGLVIEARDVNGDHAVDLVLATAWRRQPVAIFLNDGHGTFSRAEPAEFPAAFTERPTKFYSAANDSIEAFGVLPPSRSGLAAPTNISFDCAVQGEFAMPGHSNVVSSALLIPHAGRAPPSAVFYL